MYKNKKYTSTKSLKTLELKKLKIQYGNKYVQYKNKRYPYRNIKN